MSNIPYHEHTFVIPTATTEEIAAGIVSDKAVTPDQLLPVLESLDFSEAMAKLIYDPNNVAADVFDMDNMVEGATNLILTAAERALIASAIQPGGTITVADDPYDATTWNGSTEVPTKNAVRDKLELMLGTTLPAAYQPLDSDLTAIAALTTTSFGRSFLDRADAAAGRTLLGLGTSAVVDTGTSGTKVPLLDGANTWSANQTLTGKLWQGGISAAAQGTNASGFASSTAGASLVMENTSASGSGGGGGFLAYSNDGAAMASGDRLGLNLFGGSSSASAIRNTAGIAAYASQAWVDASAYGTRLEFQTTANGGTSRTTKLILGNGGLLAFGATEASTVPALKPSSAVLQARLGDDSDYAIVSVKSLTVSDAATTRSNLGLAIGTNVRELLAANRTYYVRTDGSDSNTGLANTSGGAFLTLQKAANVVASLDAGTYDVTIQVGAGTYAAGVTFKAPLLGTGSLNLTGDTTTPSNVVISVTGGDCIGVQNGCPINIGGFKLATTTSGNGIVANSNSIVTINGKMDFGAVVGQHIYVLNGAKVTCTVAYNITGGAARHMYAAGPGSQITNAINTVTLSGTPAFSTAFAVVDTLSAIVAYGQTYSGSATGTRYLATTGAGINTAGGGASYFPGNAAGSATSPGWYA